MRRALRLAVLGSVLLAGAALGTLWLAWAESERVLDAPIRVTEPVLYRLDRGASMARLARDFETHGWVAHATLFALRARLDGHARGLKAGTYAIAPGDTPRAVLERLVAGRTAQFDVTFIEGSTFAELRERLAAAPHLGQTLAGLDDAGVLAALGIERASAEGLFFPSTYRYEAGSDDRELLERAHRRLLAELDAAWQARDPELPYATPYEALIMASIVEKETGRADERRAIAGVFVRRLVLGMKLQTDPTVIYGLGDAFDGNLRRADLRRDTPFNTYTRHGLPPTPIAMPGAAAIRAALDPAPGQALYFVARGDGTHAFSETLAEHNAAVRKYQLAGRAVAP